MDWLLKRQKRIEKKLAQRHLADGDMVPGDLSTANLSAWIERDFQFDGSRLFCER